MDALLSGRAKSAPEGSPDARHMGVDAGEYLQSLKAYPVVTWDLAPPRVASTKRSHGSFRARNPLP
ncbi:MAG: hypothetical protein ACMG6S_13235, partial [Byssovorax sp.]